MVLLRERSIRNDRTVPDIEHAGLYARPEIYFEGAFDGEADEFRVFESDFDVPFSNEKPPVYMVAPMAQIEWKYANGVCAKLPESAEPIGKTVEKVLIPYGCTNLRITETYRAKR